jgi:predicted dehydrogenase
VQVPGGGEALRAFYDDFVAAVQGSGSLTCPGHEGINAVELANAMLLSSAEGTAVQLPLDRRAYSEFIETKMHSAEPQPV